MGPEKDGRNLNAKNNSRNEQDENQLNNDYPDLNVHDMNASDLLYQIIQTVQKLLNMTKIRNKISFNGVLGAFSMEFLGMHFVF